MVFDTKFSIHLCHFQQQSPHKSKKNALHSQNKRTNAFFTFIRYSTFFDNFRD